MAICSVCAKCTKFGLNDTFSHKRSNRTYKPNLKKVRVVSGNGTHSTEYVCTRCLRSNKVRRVTAGI
ncbi:MAG: 50S ribosomal protein L28 [Oscillospiraceae bacterium]|nr:50S ribosomal protein L28 [Oscillospiraceae bacterium]